MNNGKLGKLVVLILVVNFIATSLIAFLDYRPYQLIGVISLSILLDLVILVSLVLLIVNGKRFLGFIGKSRGRAIAVQLAFLTLNTVLVFVFLGSIVKFFNPGHYFEDFQGLIGLLITVVVVPLSFVYYLSYYFKKVLGND